jgi:hypothetical protein
MPPAQHTRLVPTVAHDPIPDPIRDPRGDGAPGRHAVNASARRPGTRRGSDRTDRGRPPEPAGIQRPIDEDAA